MVMLETLKRYLGNGWVEFDTTCTYASADDPTYTMYVAGNATTYLWAGMRFKCTQTTDRMFIITAVGNYDSGNNRTPITLYGGTDFDLANATISNPYYSPVKCPYGFPMNPDKWSVKVNLSGGNQQSPVANTWYNISSNNLKIPIGCWNIGYMSQIAAVGSGGYLVVWATLSNANNTEWNTELTVHMESSAGITQLGYLGLMANTTLTMTSKTTLYFNLKTTSANTTGIYITDPSRIWAVCAYL